MTTVLTALHPSPDYFHHATSALLRALTSVSGLQTAPRLQSRGITWSWWQLCCPCVCWTLIPLLAGGELTALPPPSVFLYRLPGPKLLPHSNRSHLGSPLGGCWWQLKILDVWYRMCQDKILATQDFVFLCVDLWDRLLCLVVSRRLEVSYIFSFTSQTCETSKQIMKHMISH